MSADARRSINRRLALTKQADGKGLIGETLGKGINAARGYFGLLGGGNVAKIRKGLETTRRRIGRTNEILQHELPVVGEMPTKTLRADANNTWLNRTLDRLTGRKRDWDKWEAAVAKWQPKRELYSGLQSRLTAREAELAQALTKEREAVAKTRLLTGTGVLATGGAGYGVYNAMQDGEKKAAEAAFIQGFCKAAEAAGVDPVALYKRADIGDSLWRALPDTSRGALVYHGLADPGTLLPLAGTIGGIHQVATALNPRREASKTERAIRGVAGLGLTAGGTYAMLDNDAKQAVRNAVYKLVGKLSRPATVAKALDTVAGRRAMA